MAQLSLISKVQMPSGSTYVIKDEAVWNALTEILGAPTWNETNQCYEFPAGNINNLEEVTNIFNNYTQEQNEYITNINEAATYDVTETLDSESSEYDPDALPTAGTVKDYVDAQVGALHNFDVVIDPNGTAAGPSLTATEDNMYKLVLVPDNDASAGTYIEWILVRNSAVTPNTYTWEAIGSTKMNLTGFVTEEALEGVKIGDTALGSDLKWTSSEVATELGLKALAYKDNAEGTVAAQTFDNVTATGSITATVSGATLSHTDTAAVLTTTTYTPAGNVSVSLTTATANFSGEADYTPTGSVTAATGSSTTVLSSVTFEADQNGAIQMGGTNAASAVTFDNTGSTVTVVTGVTGQTAPSFTEGAFTSATITYSTATTTYTNVALAATPVQNETLIFATPTTVYASDITAFNGGSKAADTFSAGSYGTLDTDSAIKTLGAATAAAQVFTGSKYTLGSSTASVLNSGATFNFSGNQATISVTGQYEKATGATGSFTATNNVDVPTAVTYKKAEIGNVTVTISDPVLNVSTFTVTAKTVTVS